MKFVRGAGLLLLASLWGCAVETPGSDEAVSSGSAAVTAPVPLGCDSAACCPAGTTVRTLSSNADTLNDATAKQCIVALAGSDTIFSSGTGSAVLAGDGDDTIMAGAGAFVRGGAGRDTINGFSNGTVYGGYGDDVIFSGNGNNFVYPGPGLDTVSLGTGNDTVAIYDLCELTAGEQLVGGTGNNTLITPVSLAQLQARGVSVVGFQNVLVRQNSCKSECVAGNECSGRGTCIEGSVTGQFNCDCPIGYSGARCEIAGEPQLPSKVPDAIKTPIPGYVPGSLACDTPIVFDNANAPNFQRKLQYRQNPAPGCEAKFCSSTGFASPESPIARPTEVTLNGQVAASSTCPATPGKNGIDCMVLPGTAQNTCYSDRDCSNGLVCARVCSGALCKTSERRCGQPATSCLPQPAEGSCEDASFRMCADEAPGKSTRSDYQAAFAPVSGTPSGLPAAPEPLRSLARLGDFNRCGAAPEQPVKNLGQESPFAQKDDGSGQFGVYVKPVLKHSAKFSPSGLGETHFEVNTAASLISGVKLFGKSFDAIVADAHAFLGNCKRDVAATVTIFGDELVATPGGAVDGSLTAACTQAETAWTSMLSEVQQANVDARKAVELYKKNGPSSSLCNTVRKTINDQILLGKHTLLTSVQPSQLDCENNLQNAGVLATNVLVEHYRNARQQALDAFAVYSAKRAIYTNHNTYFLNEGKPFSVVGGEANFPIGPVTLTIAGELYGSWGLGGQFGYSLELGTAPNIGAVAKIGPFVNLEASVFAGVGLPGVSIGVEGTLRLIHVGTTANIGMTLKGQLLDDPRPIGDWAGTALPGFPSKIVTWQAPWQYGASLKLESLSGHFDLAARIRLFFFKKTFRKRLFSWTGFEDNFDLTSGGAAAKGDTADFGKFGDAQVVTEVQTVNAATPVETPDIEADFAGNIAGESCGPVVK